MVADAIARGMMSSVDGNKAPELFALVITSTVVLFTCLVGEDIPTYAFIFSIVSMGISSIMLVLQVWKAHVLDDPVCEIHKFGSLNTGFILAVFLFFWWVVGAGICTFRGPFTTVSNGYIGCWGSLVACIALMGECALHPEEHAKRKLEGREEEEEEGTTGKRHDWKSQSALLICGFAVMFDAIQTFEGTFETGTGAAKPEDAGWEAELVMAVTVLVMVGTFVVLFGGPKLEAHGYQPLLLAITAFGATLWALEVAVGTFRAPFDTATNGYFASWAGLLFAMQVTKPYVPEEWLRKLYGLQAKLIDALDGDTDEDEPSVQQPNGPQASAAKRQPTSPTKPAPSASVVGAQASRKASHGATGTSTRALPASASSSDVEARLLPLIDALGEARMRIVEVSAERDALRKQVAEGGSNGLTRADSRSGASVGAGEGDHELAELRRARDEATRSAEREMRLREDAELRLEEAEAAVGDLERELSEMEEKLAEGAGGVPTEELEQALAERDDARRERDEARAALAKAEGAATAAEAELQQRRERDRMRAEAGKARLASRQATSGARRGGAPSSPDPNSPTPRRRRPPGDEDSSPLKSRAEDDSPTPRRRKPLGEEGGRSGKPRRTPRRQEDLGRDEEGKSTKERPPRPEARRRRPQNDEEADEEELDA